MIDFSTMRNVRVDAEKKRAYVEPGATLADLDEATQAHGLATPVGINSTTGIAGLTLGGFGWLTRKMLDHLTIWCLQTVTADGKRFRASERKTPTILGNRGGGGNFGCYRHLSSSFMRSVQIPADDVFLPFNQAKQVLTQYREFVGSVPRNSMCGRYCARLHSAVSSRRGAWQRGVASHLHTGDVLKAGKMIEPRGFFAPHAKASVLSPTAVGKAFDPPFTPARETLIPFYRTW
jgi:hypothetical protein